MLSFLFSPMGRINRYQYWLHFFLPYIGITIAAAVADVVVYGPPQPGQPATGPISLVVGVLFLWPSIAVSVKRLHDRSISGWWFLAAALPLAAAAVLYIQAGYTPETAPKMSPGEAYPLLALMAMGVVSNIVLLIQTWFMPSVLGSNEYGDEPPKR